MRVIDSSGWIEYFSGGPLAGSYADLLEMELIVTPTVVLYEVYKIIRREHSEEAGLLAVAKLKATRLVELDESLALSAAEISLERGLAMTDAIVYATACREAAELVTSDADLANLPNVMYLPKPN
jgi:predicted nucleic acid-binding protein